MRGYSLDDCFDDAFHLAHTNLIMVREITRHEYTKITGMGTPPATCPSFAAASRVPRVVLIGPSPCDKWIHYATLLHELGHILSKNQFVFRRGWWERTFPGLITSKRTVHNEIDAWVWAKDHALMWTPIMERRMLWALGTYGISEYDPRIKALLGLKEKYENESTLVRDGPRTTRGGLRSVQSSGAISIGVEFNLPRW